MDRLLVILLAASFALTAVAAMSGPGPGRVHARLPVSGSEAGSVTAARSGAAAIVLPGETPGGL